MDSNFGTPAGISAATYSDYLLLINVPPDVEEIVGKCKIFCEKKIGPFDGRHSQAHISIAQQQRQMPITMGQKLDYYQRSLLRLKPVELAVSNFGVFDNKSAGFTVYAHIETNPAVTDWFKKLGGIFGSRQHITPHITIAKTIPRQSLQKLWPAFERQQYHRVFIPQTLTVLTRPSFNAGNQYWRPFKELHFSK